MISKILPLICIKNYSSPTFEKKQDAVKYIVNKKIKSVSNKISETKLTASNNLQKQKLAMSEVMLHPTTAETIYSPTTKTTMGLSIRILIHPYLLMITKMISDREKYPTILAALKDVKKNPFLGLSTVIKGFSAGTGTMFVVSDVLKTSLPPFYARTSAAVISSAVTTPFDNYRLLLQTEKCKTSMIEWIKSNPLQTIYKGYNLGTIGRFTSWSLGLAAGEKLENVSKEAYGDKPLSNVAAKTLGLTITNLVFSSPIYNLQVLSVTKNQKISDSFKEFNITAKEEKGKSKALHMLKNASKLWRGSIAFLPISIISGMTVSLAESAGNYTVKKCKNLSK